MRFDGYCKIKRVREVNENENGEIEWTLVTPSPKTEKERHELLALSSCYQEHPDIQYKTPLEGFYRLQVMPKGQKKLGEK